MVLLDIIFDVLMVNGKSVIDLPLRDRHVLVKRCIPTPIDKCIGIVLLFVTLVIY